MTTYNKAHICKRVGHQWELSDRRICTRCCMTRDDLLAKTTKEMNLNAQRRYNSRARYGDPFYSHKVETIHNELLEMGYIIRPNTAASLALAEDMKKYI